MKSAPVYRVLQPHHWLVRFCVFIKPRSQQIPQDEFQRWSVSLERLVNDLVFDFLDYIDTNNLNYKNLLSSRGIWYFSVIKMISILWSSDIDVINSQHSYHLPVFVLLEVTGQWEWSWRIQLHLETRRALFSCKTSAFGRGRHHTRAQQTPRSPM